MKLNSFLLTTAMLISGILVLGISVYGGVSSRASLLFLDSEGKHDLSEWGHWTESYIKNPTAPTIAIFQRWSLSEMIDSKMNREARYPMQESENELFRALANYIPTLPSNTVVVTDSCSGAFSRTHGHPKNGWTFAALEQNLKESDFSFIPTFLPWKLEMVLSKSNSIICGENDIFLERQDLAFAHLREDLAAMRGISNASTRLAIVARFRQHLADFDEALQLRSDNMIKILKRIEGRNIVVISHSALTRYLLTGLEASKLNVNVFETHDFRSFAADPDLIFHSFLRSAELTTSTN